MFYLTVFVIPVGFVFALGLLASLVTPTIWERWLMGLGWDCHVLAWGALGGVFSNANIEHRFERQGEVAAVELVCVVALLILAVCILFLRKTEPHVGWKALVALALGGASLVVPVAIAFTAHM